MAPKPLTMAIFWVLILALNLFAVAVFIWVLSRPNGITRWWNIVLVVVGVFGAITAGFRAWQCWKLHKVQAAASLPYAFDSRAVSAAG
ncbi:hypothetical protein C8J57DRAFT_1325849 [Mycena rebaudengoi]|nr:hypothetical protein C8J57DRAFT_1325849 [Mycena rebaudengoi]